MKTILSSTVWASRGAVLLLGLTVILATFAFAAPAEPATPARTILTIMAQGTDLSGKVKSMRKSCLGGRNIKLYRQRGAEQKPSTDDLIATDTSERQGNIGVWSTGNTGMTGKFYVRTAKKPGCKAGASKTIRVSH